MAKQTIEQRYKKAVAFATTISNEMSWIQANREILRHSSSDDVEKRMIGTYAGNAWKTLRRTIWNEINISLARVLIDENPKVASLPKLYELLQDKELMAYVETKYTQGEGTFEPRMRQLQARLKTLIKAINDDSSHLKPLIRHRNSYVAHTAEKPYSGPNKVKWGDEEKWIRMASNIAEPMENIFLNVGNRSASTGSSYATYAKKFWGCFKPENDD